MPKGQQRSNREAKKPKQPKKPAGPAAPLGVPSGRPNPFAPRQEALTGIEARAPSSGVTFSMKLPAASGLSALPHGAPRAGGITCSERATVDGERRELGRDRT